MAWIDVDGARLAYEWHGEDAPAARTLVFLHEGLGAGRGWHDLPPRLAAALGARALVWDRRGYGRSEPLRAPLEPSFMHEEALRVLPRLLERLAVEDPVLVGHSDGASIALLYAGSGRPVRALALEAPHVLVEDLTVASIARVRDRYASDAGFREAMARQHERPDELVRAWTGAWLSEAFRGWSIESSLPAIACPILLIQGDRDEYGTLRQVETIRSRAAGPVELVVLPGCAHAPHRERPERVLAELRAFLAPLL